jgi:two-component system chemotaxis response regulator CheB
MAIIKVLIVEDSKLMQQVLKKILSSDPEINIIGTATDPLIARELIKQLNPDVLTLDIMLPHMDGITFLKNLMRLHPIPVVMVSTLTQKDSAIALEALAIGAIDYLAKPVQNDMNDLTLFSKELINSVKNAAKANVKKTLIPMTVDTNFLEIIYESHFLRNELIAIGASTGGIEAIETILLQLPKVFPPILIVQHIKKEFNSAFSKRIRKLYGLSIVEPENHMEIVPGCIYIAPGEYHLLVQKQKNHYIAIFDDSPPIKNHKPSINKLFSSVAVAAGAHSVGILLTGMGSDGALGLKAIHDAGGQTIAQDKESSVVWGMPSAAIKMDAVDYIVPLNNIPQKMLQILDFKMTGIKTP